MINPYNSKILVTTQDELSGYEITETLGIVKGNSVRARHIGNDIMAGFRNIVGGEVVEYTKLMAEAREQALDRMMANAAAMGANAVVCMRMGTSSIMSGASEMLAYGTAVKVVKKS
jgi:uncharacterized protein YbjQ (UPF0145 family)